MKAGRILYIIALVLEVVSLVLFMGVLGNIPHDMFMIGVTTFLITLFIVLLEFYAYSKHTTSREWNIFLLVLGAVSVLLGFSNGQINIGGALLIIGAVLVLMIKTSLVNK